MRRTSRKRFIGGGLQDTVGETLFEDVTFHQLRSLWRRLFQDSLRRTWLDDAVTVEDVADVPEYEATDLEKNPRNAWWILDSRSRRSRADVKQRHSQESYSKEFCQEEYRDLLRAHSFLFNCLVVTRQLVGVYRNRA